MTVLVLCSPDSAPPSTPLRQSSRTTSSFFTRGMPLLGVIYETGSSTPNTLGHILHELPCDEVYTSTLLPASSPGFNTDPTALRTLRTWVQKAMISTRGNRSATETILPIIPPPSPPPPSSPPPSPQTCEDLCPSGDREVRPTLWRSCMKQEMQQLGSYRDFIPHLSGSSSLSHREALASEKWFNLIRTAALA